MTYRNATRTAAIACCCLFATACAEWNSIYRTQDLKNESLVTDAKQRVVLNVPARGGPAVNMPARIYCAEPSPDVAQALSQSLSAALEVEIGSKGKGSGQVAQSSVESIAQLGERLATIQLLRDGYYRTCEAYANGAVSDTTYAMILGGIDDVMATLLSAELAAGAFGRALAKAGGESAAGTGLGPGVDPEKIAAAQKEQVDFQAEIAAEEKRKEQAEAAGNQDDVKKSEVKLAELRVKEQGAADRLREAKRPSAFASASSRPGQSIGQLLRQGSTNSAQAVTAIHRTFIEQPNLDALFVACVTALDRTHPLNKDGVDPSTPMVLYTSGEYLKGKPRRTVFTEVCENLFSVPAADAQGQIPNANHMPFFKILDIGFKIRTETGRQKVHMSCLRQIEDADRSCKQGDQNYCVHRDKLLIFCNGDNN
ncbi:MAG: hypothetical protein QNJ67_00420 [Kiloniellales bacterium]|nr:hypothetical protein [Kiloniellales bacterium]